MGCLRSGPIMRAATTPQRAPVFLRMLSFSRTAFLSSAQLVRTSRPLSHGALLDPLLLSRAQHNSLHINAGQVDTIWFELPRLDYLFHLGNRDPRSSGHYRIEVSSSLAEDQIAPAVG